jgi:hypothetical protein
MQFASISEAFGVDSLEKEDVRVPAKKIERVRFPAELIEQSDEIDELPTLIPDDRKLSELEVKQYLSNLHSKQGLNAVWNLLDPKIKRHILEKCKKSFASANKWFEDLLTSPEKLLVILAILFVLILLLDSTGKKQEAPTHFFRPQEQFYYMPPQMQQMPHQAPEFRW